MIFSIPQYRRLKSRIRIRYSSQWKKFQKNLRPVPAGALKEFLLDNRELLEEYTSFNWFYLKQLETFVFLQLLKPRTGAEAVLSQDEELIFDLWNNSEFADVFLKALNRKMTVQKASSVTLRHYEKHLLILGKRHLEKENVNSKDYRVQTVLGERTRHGKVSPLLSTTLHLDGKDLELMTHSLKEMNQLSQKIDLATKIIRKFSPSSWERFVSFTDKIIPIKNKEFVSYSHQDFPCVSMINLYNRDFVDLMDDLLHENGHHHLNHYLNLEKLIVEPESPDYYSPWRKTMRPLRGIYHAYFTFFWAFDLFSNLASAKNLDTEIYTFSAGEKEKIFWRAIEEWHMLNYSYADLKLAHSQKLISKKGWELIQRQHKLLKRKQKSIAQWERKLVSHRNELKELKSILRQQDKLRT